MTYFRHRLTMNYLKLPANKAIYIPADGIHAYLAGDIIECMARSNNVLNVGFCPRAERNDANLFVSTLTFAPHSVEECILDFQKFDRSTNGHTQIIKPPMAEFNMLMTNIPSQGTETNKAVGGPSAMIVTKGEGKMRAGGKTHDLKTGYIFFIGQSVQVEYETDSNLEVYRAFAE
jgi:mannose-6-phosphate isomerase